MHAQDHITNLLAPPGTRILVAVSGGVDSTAAAAILVEAGYACVGATLDLETGREGATVGGEPRFKPGTVDKAKAICARLNMPHRVISAGEAFSCHVINHFAAEYASGRTPNPCIRCNRRIKFGLLFQAARRWECEGMATGHYARLMERNERMTLRRAAYLPKDQSYALAPLSQGQLRRSCFPLGDMTKVEALALAVQVDPDLAGIGESQDICFVSDGDYARIVEGRASGLVPGQIRDLAGNVLGKHRGIHHYTLGQRRGLGVSAEEPLYVVRIDAPTNTIYVGRDKEARVQAFTTGRLCWGGMQPTQEPFRALVQLRYKHTPAPCLVSPTGNHASVQLDRPERSVTPGQWAVFYDEDGWVQAAAEIQEFVLSKMPDGEDARD